jgi:cytochrome c oxidase subunit 2
MKAFGIILMLAEPYRDMQSALSPAGFQAHRIWAYWWMSFWLLLAVYVLVLVFSLIPAWRKRIRTLHGSQHNLQPANEQRLTFAVSIATAATVVILFALLIGDFVVGNRNHALAHEPAVVTIKVTGHQWWWEVGYLDVAPSNTVTDANEIHLPLNQTVRLELYSADVIHSFWAPNMSGKKDLIPGHPTSLWLRADRAGTYWGQCAEFCGHQHAHMRFAVIVQPRDEFDAWMHAARQPAHEPSSDMQKQGKQVFLGRTCSMCHTITGTPSGGRLGPELTHIASRATIAAGSLPNSMGHLGGWVIDPQGVKPGTIMPANALSPADLQALLEYLESLK